MIGFARGLVTALVLLLVAIACVVAFWAAGPILIIAALVAPAAIARLLTDCYSRQFVISLRPGFGLNAAGMIAVLAEVLIVAAWRFGPFGPRVSARR